MERKRVCVKGGVREGMRKIEGEWDRMGGGESKTKWERAWGEQGSAWEQATVIARATGGQMQARGQARESM